MIILLSVIVVTLTASSIQSISADHLEPGKGIFSGSGTAELVQTQGDSKYQVYLQIVLRNADGQLVNVTESTAAGAYIPHAISDHVFDNLMSETEIITIDSVKYEKAQWKFSPTLEQRFIGLYPIYSEIKMEIVSEHGPGTAKMYEENKDFSIWKIHYCADFSSIGHKYECIPIFQALIGNLEIEPTDIVIQQWTILRELN